DPPPRQELPALRFRRSLDQAEEPAPSPPCPLLDCPLITAVRPDPPQTAPALPGPRQHLIGPLFVLHGGAVNHDRQHVAQRMDEEVALPPGTPPFIDIRSFASCRSPLSVVRTLWLSRMPTEGSGSRPSATRNSRWRASCSRWKVPSRFQRAN